jgi:hypothetical protein
VNREIGVEQELLADGTSGDLCFKALSNEAALERAGIRTDDPRFECVKIQLPGRLGYRPNTGEGCQSWGTGHHVGRAACFSRTPPMPNELQSLSSIFNNRVFRIPDYQRGYAWTDRQLNDFWEDLDRLETGRTHYTGQLSLERVTGDAWQLWDEDPWLIEQGDYKPYFVVDGQQRLTTAIILIKCLLDTVSEEGELGLTKKRDHEEKYLVRKSSIARAYLFGYEKDNPSYEYFKTQVLGEQSNQYQSTETTYTANLGRALTFFRAKIESATVENVERWFRTITQRFRFNIYELDDDLDVFVAFETMNNRGKPLSQLELLKNRLIYLSTLLPAPALEESRRTIRRNVNDAWRTVFEELGRSPQAPLDDDDFLRAHWIMYFIYARNEAAQYARFLLGEHFTAVRVRSGELSDVELQRYVTSIQDSVRQWHAIHFPGSANLSVEVERGLERLARLGRGAFPPLLMAALQGGYSDANKVALIDAAERFVFAVGRLCQRRADTGDSEYYRLAGQLYRGDSGIDSATSAILDRTENYYSREKAITDMCDLFNRAEGFYSWGGLRYFLFEYEQELRTAAGMTADKLTWAELHKPTGDYVSVEHIYPRSATPADWPAYQGMLPEQRHRLAHTLGNLLPLSTSRNAKFSNRPFVAKKQDVAGARGYFNGSYSEIAVAQNVDWTPSHVLARGLAMLDFMEKRWKIDLGTRQDKLRLLNLDFME